MKIIYKTGDMFEGSQGILVHGCNASGGFGSGVAGVIRKKYPVVYESYINAFNKKMLSMGSVHWVKTEDDRIIGNAITQEKFGGDGKLYVSYDAIETAIKNINRDMHLVNLLSDTIFFATTLWIAFPLIGAGLGGGKWSIISSIIENNSNNFQPVVYTLDGKIPD